MSLAEKKCVLKVLSGRHFGICVSKKRMFLKARIWGKYCQKDNAKCCLCITLGSEIVWSSYSVMVVQIEHGIDILFLTFCSGT